MSQRSHRCCHCRHRTDSTGRRSGTALFRLFGLLWRCCRPWVTEETALQAQQTRGVRLVQRAAGTEARVHPSTARSDAGGLGPPANKAAAEEEAAEAAVSGIAAQTPSPSSVFAASSPAVDAVLVLRLRRHGGAPPIVQNPWHALLFIAAQFATWAIYLATWSLPGNPLNLDMSFSTPAARYNDCLVLVFLSVATFSVGRRFRITTPRWRRAPCRQAALEVLLFTMAPAAAIAFGALNNVPWLHNSLMSADAWRPPALFVYLLAAIVLVCLMLRASILTCMSRRPAACVDGMSEITILLLLLFFVCVLPPLLFVHDADFHLHHYQVAFICSLFCSRDTAFDHLSLWLLLGIMVQGIAVYGADPLLVNTA